MENKLKGVLMSIDALLSAILLFGILIISFKLAMLSQGPNEQVLILRDYVQDTLVVSQKIGAIDKILTDNNDTALHQLMSGLPPAICMQIEIYDTDIKPTKLDYVYIMEQLYKRYQNNNSNL